MDSSQVGAQTGSCWGKVFGNKASTGGATSFRKAVVSAVHACEKEMRGDLADLMVHNKTTADRYYLLQDKGKSAARTSRKVRRIMRDHCEKSMEEETCDNHNIDDASSENALVSNRHKWTSEEESAVQSLFSHNIEIKSISVHDVRKASQDHPLLGKINPSEIRDKIRTYFKSDTNVCAPVDEEPLSLPEEEETAEQKLARFGMPTTMGKFNYSRQSPCCYKY